jgi:imidazolonepropionase-like amidohydrolase
MWGTIETGKNAEMIILKKNPLEDIKNIAEIETTIMGGKLYNNKDLIRKL